jgi:hypothetical protein
VAGAVPNLFRIALHPDGFAGRSRNLADWSPYLLRHLERALARHDSPALRQLAEEAEGWPGLPPRGDWSRFTDDETTEAVMTWHVTAGGCELSFFTIMSTLGTPLDITLSELAIEMFFPADTVTEEFLRSHRPDAGLRSSRPATQTLRTANARPARRTPPRPPPYPQMKHP